MPSVATHSSSSLVDEIPEPSTSSAGRISSARSRAWTLLSGTCEEDRGKGRAGASRSADEHGRIRLECVRDISPGDEAERLALLRDRDGLTAFVRIGKECGHDDAWPGRSEELVATCAVVAR